MTRRERVLKTVNFEEPDRVPIDLGGSTGASGIHVIAYNNLRKHLGLATGTVQSNDVMQQLAVVDETVRERFRTDVLRIDAVTFARERFSYPLFDGLDVEFPTELNLHRLGDGSWILQHPSGKRYVKPPNGLYFDAEDGRGWYGFGMPMTDEALDELSCNTRGLYESTDYALTAGFGGAFSSHHPDFLMALATEPGRVQDELSRRCDALIEKVRLINQAIGAYTFCVVFADDHGTQNAPMMSPDMFAEMIAPHYGRFADWLHANTDLKLFLHSCGAVEPLIETYIQSGIDILNPVQTSAAGMDPQVLKERYGGRIVFWGGGCDTQSVLGFRTPEEVAEHVRERIRIFAPGGGFVFNQVHAIQASVPPEQICAMLDAAFEFGSYPRETTTR